MDQFPVEINTADYFTLLRIPGIGVISAKKIIRARRAFLLNFDSLKKLGALDYGDLKKIGVVLKRAVYFITCKGKYFDKISQFNKNLIETSLIFQERNSVNCKQYEQLSLFDKLQPTKEDKIKCLTGSL